ncbi:hypothetical protein M8C21_020701 [Ambrosia artemisiifolia]|uniref:Uncharacterized protein n=1 Tax=Ambrosia artemisiifolia TaxID=4212 RepID=A0AAD5CJG4_AMBAR|nr:hypothetical protein M8C21_020701 [Ambrosia artemisiifolia]
MDLSNLPDPQRQEVEQLHKQFQQHQSQQQPPPPYEPFHAHQPHDPSHPQQHAFDQSSYYYNYQHQYDPSFYQNYYPNSSYQQQPQDPYVSSVNAGAGQPNLGYGVPPGIDPAAAAAAVAALSHLTQFAGGGHYDPGHFRPPD